MQKKILASVVLGVAVVTCVILIALRQERLDDQANGPSVYTLDGEIVALDEPTFTTLGAMDAVLGDELWGIDVAMNGEHWYFPVQIMNYHYVANVTLGEQRTAVTYDPLTGSAAVFALAPGDTLAASGTIYDNSMLLKDASGALWWQTTGTPFDGGEGSLTEYPFAMYTWADWKDAFPGGNVLSDETGYAREYNRHPYGGYDESKAVYFPIVHPQTRFDGIKAKVYGVVVNGEAVAFARPIMVEEKEVRVTVGGQALVGIYDDARDVVRVYKEEGMEELSPRVMFWFAWASAHPTTLLAGEESLVENAIK